MPVTVPSYGEIEAQVDAFFRTRFPGRDLGSESWLGKQIRAISMALLSLQKSVGDADADGTPSARTSPARLDEFAVLFGLPSNSGGFGRDLAVAATGGAGTLRGTNATVYGDGLILYASDGATKIKLSGAVTLPGAPPGTSTAPGAFVAETKGNAGNLRIGSILTFASPPTGADSTVALTTALTGGADAESDASLLKRIFDRLQQPPKGGAAADYKVWSEQGSPLVSRAYVYPNRGGTGTVQSVITRAGSGITRKPATSVRDAVDAFVLTKRPVTVQEFKTLLPATAASGVRIQARLKPARDKYKFDWDDSAAVYSVVSWAPGPPVIVVINNESSLSTLKTAIDAGLKPRLQLEITGGPIVPVPIRATAWAPFGAGTIGVTLENPLPAGALGAATVATAGDRVTASGPIAKQIGDALLAYVDALGPSRAEGFSGLEDTWEDAIAIARLTEIALSQIDAADGLTRLVANVAVPGGITIDGMTADRVAAADIAGAPELLYAKFVVVIQ